MNGLQFRVVLGCFSITVWASHLSFRRNLAFRASCKELKSGLIEVKPKVTVENSKDYCLSKDDALQNEIGQSKPSFPSCNLQ